MYIYLSVNFAGLCSRNLGEKCKFPGEFCDLIGCWLCDRKGCHVSTYCLPADYLAKNGFFKGYLTVQGFSLAIWHKERLTRTLETPTYVIAVLVK